MLHSTTKYINGHSDVVGGAVIAANAELHQELTWWANALGLTGSPFDSFLTLRGLRTLEPRLRVHCENAEAIAEVLDRHPAVHRVHIPASASPRTCWRNKQRHAGAMISFEGPAGGEAAVRAFLDGLRYFTLAESLGGVGKPGRPSRDHDPCRDERRSARTSRHHRRPAAPVHRH